ncbi:hypothetical protein ACIP9C_20870 [Lysinibacillus sp. NPDC093210]|uniref:hypothetical protein n=1 Tax=Lysinibacillus sp. NPDC093210 TaxID=3364133 RepID=UPI003813CA02
MSFFNIEVENIVAITSNNEAYIYNEIPIVEFKSEKKELILILCQNTIEILFTYISAMNSKHAVMLVSSDINRELLAITGENHRCLLPKMDCRIKCL